MKICGICGFFSNFAQKSCTEYAITRGFYTGNATVDGRGALQLFYGGIQRGCPCQHTPQSVEGRGNTEGRFFCDIADDVTKEPSLCYTSEHMGDEHRGGLLHVVATGVEKRIEGELRPS